VDRCATPSESADPPLAGGASAAAKPENTKPQAEPRTEEAVRKVAQEEVDAYASGDYGRAWDLWTDSAKKLISRENDERLFELCPPAAAGVQFTIEKIALSPDMGLRDGEVLAARAQDRPSGSKCSPASGYQAPSLPVANPVAPSH
jgi:hypothetical protein